MLTRLLKSAAVGIIAIFSAAAPAFAGNCFAIAQNPLLQKAQLAPPKLTPEQLAMTYINHSTFLLTSASGVQIATDFAGYAGPGVTPSVVTMNNAHATHYTDYPPAEIEHVLRGWNPAGDGPARHHLELDGVKIRNVATATRGFGGDDPYGNSIFIFEVAGLCVAHLGHLHQLPTDEQLARIGFIDIVLAPVDGSYTLSQADMLYVLRKLRARVVTPMHYFGPTTLNQFLTAASDEYVIDVRSEASVIFSRETLPKEPTIIALPPYSYESYE